MPPRHRDGRQDEQTVTPRGETGPIAFRILKLRRDARRGRRGIRLQSAFILQRNRLKDFIIPKYIRARPRHLEKNPIDKPRRLSRFPVVLGKNFNPCFFLEGIEYRARIKFIQRRIDDDPIAPWRTADKNT